jgi:hypothetical protein
MSFARRATSDGIAERSGRKPRSRGAASVDLAAAKRVPVA